MGFGHGTKFWPRDECGSDVHSIHTVPLERKRIYCSLSLIPPLVVRAQAGERELEKPS